MEGFPGFLIFWLFWGWVFPDISHIHTAYIGIRIGFLHFRYLNPAKVGPSSGISVGTHVTYDVFLGVITGPELYTPFLFGRFIGVK